MLSLFPADFSNYRSLLSVKHASDPKIAQPSLLIEQAFSNGLESYKYAVWVFATVNGMNVSRRASTLEYTEEYARLAQTMFTIHHYDSLHNDMQIIIRNQVSATIAVLRLIFRFIDKPIL